MIDVVAMPFPLPGDWIVQGGATALLGVGVLMILVGQLVPRRTVRDTIKGLEAERDLWRAVALKSLGHTEVLLPAAQIAAQVTQALSDVTATGQAMAGTDRGGGP